MGKNIVLDIAATMVHTLGDEDEFLNLQVFTNPKMIKYRPRLYSMELRDVTSPPGTGEEMTLYGVYRPYLKEFIEFCFDYFDNVIIWSAGKKKYVEKMCELMFIDMSNQPLVIYNYDDCGVYDDFIRKPLKKLYEDPRVKGKMNEKNTYVLDDRDDTFALNKGNGILIPEYEASLTKKGLDKEDDNLLKLMAWLSIDVNKQCRDVRQLDKSRIFELSEKDYLKLI